MLKKCICLLAAALMFTACTSDDDKNANVSKESAKQTVIDTNKIKENKSTSDVEKAEELAKAGEQLMTPGGFFYADQIFDEALKYDSSNVRAQFYKAFNAPMMNMKGIYTRIEPMVLKEDEKSVKDYKDMLELNDYAVAIKDFLIDGEKDIDSEAKAQAFLEKQSTSYDELRQFARSNKDKVMTLNFPELLWRNLYKSRELICQIKKVGQGVYYSNCKRDFDVFTVKLERADIEALQHMSAGIVIYHNLLTAYDMTGLQSVYQTLKPRGAELTATDKEILNEVNKHEDLGVLRAGNKLAGIIGLGSDALAGVRWAQKLQKELCPAAVGHRASMGDIEANAYSGQYGYINDGKEVRRKGMAIEEGICIPEKTSNGKSVDKILKSVELALAGNVMTLRGYQPYSGKKVETMVKYSNLVENPIADLKTIPKSFNICDNIATVSDDSLNGVFVNNDASEFGQLTGALNELDCTPAP